MNKNSIARSKNALRQQQCYSKSLHKDPRDANLAAPNDSIKRTRRTRRHRPIRIAVLSSLYPNAQQPRHGIFVEQRLRALVGGGEVEAQVVAPVPWFWSQHPRYGNYARMAAIADRETRYGLTIHHPRYAVIPKVGMTLAPETMARAVIRRLYQLRVSGFDFDLIDAHYLYPDGVAAARVARHFNCPFVMTARGTDVNTIAGMATPGRQIRWATEQAERVITVSDALRRRLIERGVAPAAIQTLRNGVDLDLFAPRNRAAIRADLGVANRIVWLCVGHLTANKGVHLAVAALASVPEAVLLIVGDGPERGALVNQAARLGVADRVVFVGTLEHDQLPKYYNAADALILASGSEGMPNVVLEALACGTAVLATAVGGVPEIIDDLPHGKLLYERTPSALLEAWQCLKPQALAPGARRDRRRYAENFSWGATTRGQLDLFNQIVDERQGRDVRHAYG